MCWWSKHFAHFVAKVNGCCFCSVRACARAESRTHELLNMFFTLFLIIGRRLPVWELTASVIDEMQRSSAAVNFKQNLTTSLERHASSSAVVDAILYRFQLINDKFDAYDGLCW
jgi:hypothetical protein